MNAKLMQKYLFHLCFCVVACAYAALSVAAEADVALREVLKGRWEGRLDGAFRSQDVSWHFETDDQGALKGYMGPRDAGMPRQMMEDLVVADGRVSFSIPAQHASFEGMFTVDGVSGKWQQGSALQLQMRKKDFVFPLSAAVRAALVGEWAMQDEGIAIKLEFVEAEGGSVAGFLSIPSGDMHDIPLVDVFVTDEGFAQFATDNGRRFSGRLANGVLVGEYVANEDHYRRNFLRTDDTREEYDLALPEAARQKMLGRWHCTVRGDDVILELTLGADNQVHGHLLFDEGPRRNDKLLELKVEGDTVSYTTFNGRTFNGSFNADGIAGDYSSGNRPYGVLFTREQ